MKIKYKLEYNQSKVCKEDLNDVVDKLAEILYEQIIKKGLNKQTENKRELPRRAP